MVQLVNKIMLTFLCRVVSNGFLWIYSHGYYEINIIYLAYKLISNSEYRNENNIEILIYLYNLYIIKYLYYNIFIYYILKLIL